MAAETSAYGQSAISATKAAPKTQPIERVEIETTDSGGFIVKCYKKPKNKNMMGMIAPSKHVYKDVSELKGFIDEYLGDGTTPVAPAPAEPIAPPTPDAPVAAAADGPVDSGGDDEGAEMGEDDEDAE